MSILGLMNLRYFVVALTLLACLSRVAEADTKEELGSTIDHIFVKVVEAIGVYGQRINYCDSVAADSDGPLLDRARLGSLGATREDMILALAYFSRKNYYQCEKEERLALVFHLGTVSAVAKELQVAPDHIEKLESQLLVTSTLQDIVVFPTAGEVHNEMLYNKLPQRQRDYYKLALGGSGPYQLIQTAMSNGLTRD